ncbi:hypothetical protein [Endozoicomonas arenosclerae]|uniref:hypothetical protein n=1 Tax=Endozoicomonas arenosclerae TaxID=1633495 RepID=UPI000785B0D8|nr:hypothetical protein [Endozoicomonas arenosclerae]
MRGLRSLKILVVSVLLSSSALAASDEAPKKEYPVDPKSGLKMAPGWEMVNAQCNACHTTLIVGQNSGDEKVWRETLQWMIDTQGLWDLSETWEPILAYLSTNYGEAKIDLETFRRLPLDPSMMPPPKE